jgi:hypothetical protein
MTLYLFDIASYQAGIDLVKVKQAGFTIANVKTSQGVGYTFGAAGDYCRQAHALGMGVSVFHWLDNSGTGAAQAGACWKVLAPIVAAVGPVALQIDCEDTAKPATWPILRDFHNAMADHLGHRPYVYTGDWWATATTDRRGWNVAGLTPYLMAAPNNGYPGTYPGDGAPQWRAGYWGYDVLSLMQYAVSPIAGAGGGQISKTAIRDPAVWPALTGGSTLMAENYGRAPDPNDGGTTAMRAFELWLGEFEAKAAGYGTPSPRSARLARIEASLTSLQAKADADEVRDRALQAAFDGFVALVQQGGGSLDVAPVVAAVKDTWTAAAARFDQLHADLVAAQAREARLLSVLHAMGADLASLPAGDEAPTTA